MAQQTILKSLFKLYDISVIMLLTNNITNIFSEISKIRVILWLAHTCNVKGPEQVEKMDGIWMNFATIMKTLVDEWL